MEPLNPVHGVRAPCPRPGLWRCVGCLAVCVWLGPCVPTTGAHDVVSAEYQIKAVFLFNFLQFVEWPPESSLAEDEPIRIGVLGDDPFGVALDEAVRGERVRGRPLTVSRARRAEQLRDCHLLFISKSEGGGLDAILPAFAHRPVLTVSDADGFARQGGIIAFYPEGKKVRFEINVGSARSAGLKISSELLHLGRIIDTETDGEGS